MAVDDPLIRMDLGRRKAHFVGIVITARGNARQYFPHFGLIIDELQERLAAGAFTTDSQHVFRGGVQIGDQKAVIEQNDARGNAVENAAGEFLQRSAAGASAA